MTNSFKNYRLGGCLFESTPVAAPELTLSSSSPLPERIDLRGFCSPVEDQEDIGSCAANAVVGALEYHQRRGGQSMTDLSRLFVYYNARKLADKENEDAGTYIHHAMAAVLAFGACPESMWPYQKAMWPTKPVQACYEAAMEFEAISYARTPLGPACKSVLCAGLPVVFGAAIPAQMIQMEAGLSGRIKPRNGDWPAPGGGHAMLIVGFDDREAAWLVRNSWGTDWGDGGYAWIPYSVMERYGIPSQYWVIGDIEANQGARISAAGLKLAGASLADSQAAVQGLLAPVSGAISNRQASLRRRLEHDLSEAKDGFRKRLRGPGAGGGY